jgi:ribosomal protein S27E
MAPRPSGMSKAIRICVLSVIFVVAPAISSFARSSHSSSAGGDFGTILVIGVVVLVGLAFAAINATKRLKPLSQDQVDQLKAEAMVFFNKVEAGTLTPPETPLVLAADEIALLHEASQLIEARATRVYAGGGTRVQGIYIGGGQSGSVQSLKELDSGMLTLTTKRLVFTGSMESRVVNIKDIVSVESYADAIEISTAKRAKRQVYTVHNPIIWAPLLRTVIKSGFSITKRPADSSPDITFDCPLCGQHLTVEKSGAGMTVNCPSCSKQIEIPRGGAAV